MAPEADPVSNRLQVGLLQTVGTALRAVSAPFPGQKDRLHPPGFGRFSRWLGTAVFPPDRRRVFRFGPGRQAQFSFPLNDPYWTALLLPGREYEPEVRETLSRALIPGTVLIDCGANLGYWSCFAAAFLSPGDIVAIEPFPATFDQLLLNARLNGGFQCVRAALHKTDCQQVWLAGSPAAVVSVRDRAETTDEPGAWAQTVTLDTICERYVRPDCRRIALKLDVEGGEIAALDGATRLLERGPLIIYEDHGSDAECAVSRHISSRLGWQIYSWVPQRGFRPVQIEEIRSIKRNPRVGYNFIACAESRSWPELGLTDSRFR